MGYLRKIICAFLLVSLVSHEQRAFADGQGSAAAAQAGQSVLSMGGMLFASTQMPGCTASGPDRVMHCTMMALGIAASAASALLSGANGGVASDLNGGNYGAPGDYNFDDPNFVANDVIKDPTACTGANPNPIQCAPGGYKNAKDKMIKDLNNALSDGSITGADASKIGGILDAVKSNDLASLNAALAGSGDSLAGMEQYVPKVNNGDVAFSGEAAPEGEVASAGKGGATSNAHVDGSLGAVDWNGLLDMIDSKSGKSLTLWQRATRRYQGGAGSKRALMLARMESIRKTAIAKLKSQKGTSTVASREIKPLAKSDRKPAALAPKN